MIRFFFGTTEKESPSTSVWPPGVTIVTSLNAIEGVSGAASARRPGDRHVTRASLPSSPTLLLFRSFAPSVHTFRRVRQRTAAAAGDPGSQIQDPARIINFKKILIENLTF